MFMAFRLNDIVNITGGTAWISNYGNSGSQSTFTKISLYTSTISPSNMIDYNNIGIGSEWTPLNIDLTLETVV